MYPSDVWRVRVSFLFLVASKPRASFNVVCIGQGLIEDSTKRWSVSSRRFQSSLVWDLIQILCQTIVFGDIYSYTLLQAVCMNCMLWLAHSDHIGRLSGHFFLNKVTEQRGKCAFEQSSCLLGTWWHSNSLAVCAKSTRHLSSYLWLDRTVDGPDQKLCWVFPDNDRYCTSSYFEQPELYLLRARIVTNGTTKSIIWSVFNQLLST